MQDVFRDRKTGVAINAWLFAEAFQNNAFIPDPAPRWVQEAIRRPEHSAGAITISPSGKALLVNCKHSRIPCEPGQYIALVEGDLQVWPAEAFREVYEPVVAQETIRDQVAAFHSKFGVPVRETPGPIDGERVRLRLRLIAEEFLEVLEACGCDVSALGQDVNFCIDSRILEGDLVALADGLADLDYVVEGARQEFGINGQPIAAEVHRTNMAKGGGATRVDGKILKPEGWQPPDIAGELLKQGWEG